MWICRKGKWISNQWHQTRRLLCIKMSTSLPTVTILEGNFPVDGGNGNRLGKKMKKIYKVLTHPRRYICGKLWLAMASLPGIVYYLDFPPVENQETPFASFWLRFSFRSYWQHEQWPCNLWRLLGSLTEVVKHLDWLGGYEMCAVMAYCRPLARTTRRELRGSLCHI